MNALALVGVAVLVVLVAVVVAIALTRRRPAAKPAIEPNQLRPPWRQFVADAVEARRRFEATVARVRPGPIKDRLDQVSRRVDAAVQECWHVATDASALEAALRDIDRVDIEYRLGQINRDRHGRRDPAALDALARTEAALEAQLASADRLERVARDAAARLRVLNAQLDLLVTRAVELSVQARDASTLQPLEADVATLVGDLEALRAALEETGTTGHRPLPEP